SREAFWPAAELLPGANGPTKKSQKELKSPRFDCAVSCVPDILNTRPENPRTKVIFRYLSVVCLLSNAALFASPVYVTSIVAKSGDTIGGKTVTSVASSTGESPELNNNNQIAYEGQFAGGSAIFLDHSLVQQTGDVVGGVTLTNFGSISLNNPGLLA